MTSMMLKTQDPASIIVLRDVHAEHAGKSFRASADKPEGFEECRPQPALRWHPMAVPIKDLDHLHRTLAAASKLKDAIVIRGQMVREPNEDEDKRGVYRRLVNGGLPEAIWVPCPRESAGFDLDGSQVDDVSDGGWAWISANLPTPFQGVSFVWNLTASYGMKPGFRARLWFLFDHPVEDASLRRFASTAPAWMKLDASLFSANQPHYIAAPEFVGLADPVPEGGRWGIHRTAVERVDASALLTLRAQDKDPAYLGVTVTNLPAPNPAELERAIERVRTAVLSPGTTRHSYGCAVACELLSFGMDPEAIVEEAEHNIRIRGREPHANEGLGCLKHALQRHTAGKLTTNHTPVSVVLDRVDALAPLPPVAAENGPPAGDSAPPAAVSGEDVLAEAPPKSSALYGGNDWLNAALYRSEVYPTDGFLRWGEQDWEWVNTHWQTLENDEVLLQRLQRHTNLKAQRASATVRSFRSLMGREFLCPPCTLKGEPLPNLLAFRNGILDLERWLFDTSSTKLMPHDPSRFLTCSLPYDFDPAAECPRLRAFLKSVWAGQEDQQREFQKMLGYLLMHDNRFHRIFILLGVKRSGKGTILDLIEKLVGPSNVCSPNLSSLSNDFGLHPLLGKSVATIDEMNQQGKIPDVAVDRMKSISGGGTIPVNRKGVGELHQKLPVRFVIACNRLPGFLDPSGALASRLCIFTMWESFLGREDRSLGAALQAELPGIAQFALEGLRMLLVEDGDFRTPESAKRVALEYRAMQAPTVTFLDTCVEPASDATWLSLKDLYSVYTMWARENGHQATSNARLAIELGHRWPAEIERSKIRRSGVDGERDRQRSGFRFTAEGLEYLKQAGVFPQ